MKNFKGYILLLFILSGIYSNAFAKDLILSAPPRENAEAGMKLYGPVAAHLTKLLGVTVTYEHPGNWLKYQREMRNDKYDIVFDGPHFIAWREEHLGHEVLLKLPGKLQFMLVTDKDNKKIKNPNDLIGKNICGISPPNLSTLSVLDYYRNPVRQPVIKGIKGGMGKVYKSLAFKDKKKCDAAVLRTAFHKKKLKQAQRDAIKTLFKSKSMPNQGVSVSRRISFDLKLRIKKFINNREGCFFNQRHTEAFWRQSKKFCSG